ncbi:hypothetical protein [Pseudomonas sp. NFACC13-1]|uniref:hypothetical protein n=1 Tax=Pseudomonas sp. NFACC13-1 TaxID=1566245 RepID=UPI000882CDB7|nr:hypothetical protein [Pseudomonas sp. NFACC13-1]SDB54507.1 hypothetical protein SAMN03159290_04204 [Pseudomonas sp. NFACC13-1]
MTWYKTGTVSATLNSTAVIGTGTAWTAGCRVGDEFRGPNGKVYEVTGLGSDTAISIYPPYEGPTVSGGSYVLKPVQGYNKASADALREIVNTYGAQLAALKTTGNYDVLPVTKGGTGGTTQAEAQTALGLAPQTSTSDSTAGRLMLNGAHGLGSVLTLPVMPTLLTHLPSGLYRGVGGTTVGSPFSTASGFMAFAKRYSTNDTFYTIFAASVGRIFEGWYTTGASSIDWFEIFTTKNSVGAVSQVGGVPTGALLQRGTTTTGTFSKYACGTLICSGWSTTAATASSAAGSVFIGSGFTSFTFPHAFSSPPACSDASRFQISGGSGAGSGRGWGTIGLVTASTVTHIVYGQASNSSMYPGYVAHGRWYE